MKKINLAISGCLGRMGQQLIKSSKNNKNFKLTALTENKAISKKIAGIMLDINNEQTFKNTDVIIDFTVPNCTLDILKIASKLKKKVIIGTTGFNQKEEALIKKFSKKIPILKAGNMSLGVNLLMHLTEIASKSLNDEEAFKKIDVIIDFTVPNCTLDILKIASKLKKRVVIGTTGFNQKEEALIKKLSKTIPILKAGNMSLGVNLLMYLTEIASKSLDDKYLSKVFEIHHKHKKDYPSGTALMLGKGIADGKNKNLYNLMGKKFLNKRSFPYGKKN